MKVRERLGELLPLGQLGIQLRHVRFTIPREVRLILWSACHQRIVNVAERDFCQHRIEHVMRIAIRMDVPL